MHVLISLLLLLLSFHSLAAQNLTAKEEQALDQLVLADVREDSPGLAVGVVKNGQVIYERYAGLAQIDDQIPIDEQTRFNLASNGKQFTALCILQLAADGKLQLADDIREYLPELLSKIDAPITIAQVLNHSSGIRDMYDLWSLQGITWWEQTLNNADALQLIYRQEELNFSPGSDYLYSNSNYILLPEVVRVVTGQSFKSYSDSLFRSMDMQATRFESDHQQIANMAYPYFNYNTWRGYDWLSDLHGDGALFSTLPDQLRWETHVQKLTPGILAEGVLAESQLPLKNTQIKNYGFGLEFDEYRERPYRFHEGSTGAWKASTLRFPEKKLSIIVMTNSGAIVPFSLSRQCADVLLGVESKAGAPFQLQPAATPSTSLTPQEIMGTYQTERGYFMKIVEGKKGLMLERAGRDAIQLQAEANNLYNEVSDEAFKQFFTYDPDKGYQLTVFYPTHAPYTLTKVATDWTEVDYSALNGSYLNTETDVECTLKHDKGDQYTVRINGEKVSAQLFTPETLMIGRYRARVEQDENKEVAALVIGTNRIRNVRFERVNE